MAKAVTQYKASMKAMIGTNRQIECLIEASSTDPEELYQEIVRIVARLEEKYPLGPPELLAEIRALAAKVYGEPASSPPEVVGG